jgi:hypothetical protein
MTTNSGAQHASNGESASQSLQLKPIPRRALVRHRLTLSGVIGHGVASDEVQIRIQ